MVHENYQRHCDDFTIVKVCSYVHYRDRCSVHLIGDSLGFRRIYSQGDKALDY